MKVLIVVDMQNDFIDGSLGSEEAVKIVPKVVNKIKEFEGIVIATRDTHQADYLETFEGKRLPAAHCIEGTKGWQITPLIAGLIKEKPVDKPTFGSLDLAERIKELNNREEVESITMVGLCTDICVVSNAMILKASLPDVPVIVDAGCCAGITKESHSQALAVMKMCQIDVTNE